jgi:hypothetical protein
MQVDGAAGFDAAAATEATLRARDEPADAHMAGMAAASADYDGSPQIPAEVYDAEVQRAYNRALQQRILQLEEVCKAAGRRWRGSVCLVCLSVCGDVRKV